MGLKISVSPLFDDDQLNHECIIGVGVHVMGNAEAKGKVVVRSYAAIGTNAPVLPLLNFGEGACVGAGVVVSNDARPLAVVAGVPAETNGTNDLKFAETSLIELISQ